MRDGALGLRILASAFFVTAAGTLAFWLDWFFWGHVATSDETCYLAFEEAFPLADLLLSVALLLAAFSLFREKENALLYSFLAAGGIFSLLCLDATYNLQHGKYHHLSDPAMRVEAYVNLHCLVLGSAALWYVSKRRALLGSGAARSAQLVRGPKSQAPNALAATLFLVSLGRLAPVAGQAESAQGALDPCLAAFKSSFIGADVLVGATALAATLALLRAKPDALRSSLFVAGAILFLTSVEALFFLQRRLWASANAVPSTVSFALWYAGSLWIAAGVWRARAHLAPPTGATERGRCA